MLRGFYNRIWKGERWPQKWKEGVIVPIIEKREGERVEEYRRVTLMTVYKLHTAVLAERLREDLKGRGVISHNQTAFRKGMGTMDNVFVINYLINRQIGRKRGKLVALFVDLKAAFDSVDREVLVGTMRECGIREGLTVKVKQVIRETKSRVRIKEEIGESFWTARGVRQGCPLSLILFNILMADIEEQIRVKWGVKLGGRKGSRTRMIWCC